MNKIRSNLIALFLLAVASLACAAPRVIGVGTPIVATEVKSLTNEKAISIGNQKYRLVEVNKAQRSGISLSDDVRAGRNTLLVNSNGIVGLSRHEVVVTGLSEDQVQSAMSELQLTPDHVKAMPHVKTTVLVFQKFLDAVAARDALSKALPNVNVGLPVQFQRPKSR